MKKPRPGNPLFGLESANRLANLKATGGIPTKTRPSVGEKKRKVVTSDTTPSTLVDRLQQERRLGYRRKR